jgi:[acyl-carrier-protein] S-malonyltransferase
MKNAFIFPGQGSQFVGMGQNLYHDHAGAKDLMERANDLLGFRITDEMFTGTDEGLKQTRVTQPAIFLHSVALAATMSTDLKPHMVAGHSLGEFSALVANKTLRFEDALLLVSKRALAMQEACERQPSTMAAILGLDDAVVERICAETTEGVVVAANYNCPGQLVISGSVPAVEAACERMKAAGAKRALVLPVGGAFHSPLMMPAQEKLEQAIRATPFQTPICPIYQNVTAEPVTEPAAIQENLILQLTAPVRWTQTVESMLRDGATHFIEVGPGKVLQGLVKKVSKDVEAVSA